MKTPWASFCPSFLYYTIPSSSFLFLHPSFFPFFTLPSFLSFVLPPSFFSFQSVYQPFCLFSLLYFLPTLYSFLPVTFVPFLLLSFWFLLFLFSLSLHLLTPFLSSLPSSFSSYFLLYLFFFFFFLPFSSPLCIRFSFLLSSCLFIHPSLTPLRLFFFFVPSWNPILFYLFASE